MQARNVSTAVGFPGPCPDPWPGSFSLILRTFHIWSHHTKMASVDSRIKSRFLQMILYDQHIFCHQSPIHVELVSVFKTFYTLFICAFQGPGLSSVAPPLGSPPWSPTCPLWALPASWAPQPCPAHLGHRCLGMGLLPQQTLNPKTAGQGWTHSEHSGRVWWMKN